MSQRSSALATLASLSAGLALVASLAACGSSSTGLADVALRRLGASDVQVTVDSLVGTFAPLEITYAAFTIKNVSGKPVLVAGCIEGLAAGIEREVDGEWQFIGGSMCWGSDPRHGFPLAAGATAEGAMQVPAPGRYRIVARFATEAEREVAYDASSAPFDAR